MLHVHWVLHVVLPHTEENVILDLTSQCIEFYCVFILFVSKKDMISHMINNGNIKTVKYMV